MKINLKHVFILANIIILIASFFAFLYSGLGWLVFAFVFILNIANILFFKIAFEQDNNFLKIFSFFFLHWYLLRLPFLLLKPENFTYFSYLDFNFSGLVYSLVILFIFQLFSGFALLLIGRKTSIQFNEKWKTFLDKDFSSVFYWFVMIMVIFLFQIYVLGFGKGNDLSSIGFLRLIFSYDFALIFLSFLILFNFSNLSRGLKFKAFVFVIIAIAVFLLWGSRSAIYRFILLFVIFLLVFQQNFKFKINWKKVFLILAIILFLFFSFYIGNVYRYTRMYRVGESLSPINFPRYIGYYPFNFANLVDTISARTSLFDHFYTIVNMAGSRFSNEINIVNTGKSIINFLIPGTPFPGNLRAGRLFQVDYLGQSIEESEQVYMTNIFGLLSIGIAHFGVYTGLIISLFLVLVYPIIFFLLFFKVPNKLRNYYLFFGYYLFYVLLSGMGYDEFIFLIYIFFWQILAFLGFLVVYSLFGRSK